MFIDNDDDDVKVLSLSVLNATFGEWCNASIWPINDEFGELGRPVTDRTQPCRLLLVHHEVRNGIVAL